MAREWYFVRKLRPHERPHSLERFEVQVLDNDGRAIAIGHLAVDARQLIIQGHEIPLAVLEAAKRRPEGQGDYVDPSGERLPPF